MIGFCLAAGAGSRLEPLTRAMPKPLLAPAGRPLVDLAVEALQAAGATRVVVNAHHGADLLAAHLAGRPGVEVVAEPVLLGTGGGLANAARLGLLGGGDDPVLVTCADHVVDPADLADLAAFLDRSGAPMVTGLMPATTAAAFGLRLVEDPGAGRPGGRLPGRSDPDRSAGRLVGGSGAGRSAGRLVREPDGPWDSAGAYALRAGLLEDLDPVPSDLAAVLLGPLLERGALAGLPFRGPVADAGTLARLLAASAGLLAGRWPYALPPGRLVAGALPGGRVGDASPRDRAGGGRAVFVAEGAEVDPAAVLAGPLVVDAGSRVGAGAVVTRAVLGPGSSVGPGARVVGSVLGPGAAVPAGATAVAALLPGKGAAVHPPRPAVALLPGPAERAADPPR